VITIPAGLCIGEREIELEIEFDPACVCAEIYEVVEKGHIGQFVVTNKIRAALEAAAAYQKEIGE
jgi:hypothetical protein